LIVFSDVGFNLGGLLIHEHLFVSLYAASD
jgi:hypothetical protein